MIFNKYHFLFFAIFIAPSPTRAVLTSSDENVNGKEVDRINWLNHPCNRECKDDEESKLCKYVFVVEQYLTMSKACYDCPFNLTDCFRPHCLPADGVQRVIVTVNRQIPGPQIEVCLDDTIQVEVRNMMESESTTVHWHGLNQVGTPYMDGVPYVTQCPILPGQTFTYTFHADDAGTNFWHSHIGSQRSDGHFGSLVVKHKPSTNVHRKLYDYDKHRMVLLDWMHQRDNDKLIISNHINKVPAPDSMIINGLGHFKLFERKNETSRYSPAAVFEVEKGKRYRVRFINAGAENCPIEMTIDNHNMTIISLDSSDVEPAEVDVLTISAGERIDFVLNANQKIGNYWIRYRGYDLCRTNSSVGVSQIAILRYTNAVKQDPPGPVGYQLFKRTKTTKVFNGFNVGTESDSKYNISMSSMNATDKNDLSLRKNVDQQVFLSFDFYPIDNYDYHRKGLYGYYQVMPDFRVGTLQLNHISYKRSTFPLLSEYELIGPNAFCNSSTISPSCKTEQCSCTHVINLKLNSVVEIVFIDEGQFLTFNHPMHLHGHSFRVVAEENVPGGLTIEGFKKLDKAGKIKRKLSRAPLKDVVKVPSGGYTVVRVYANNPGYWFFHCHFDEHMNMGMSLVFKVGEHEDFAPKPKYFPKCGNNMQNLM